VELVSSKTITRALQYSTTMSLRGGKIDPDSRALVLFTKVLAQGCEDLRLNQGGCSGRTQ